MKCSRGAGPPFILYKKAWVNCALAVQYIKAELESKLTFLRWRWCKFSQAIVQTEGQTHGSYAGFIQVKSATRKARVGTVI